MIHHHRHRGFTLLELMIVLAALIILGAIIVPTLTGTKGDTNVKAAADMFRARIAEARARAMEDGINYRLAISPDGRQIRIGPDNDLFDAEAPIMDEDPKNPGENTLPPNVTATVVNDEVGDSAASASGWIRVATFEPIGTCRENVVDIEIREPGVYTMIVRLRGLTGAVSYLKQPLGGSP